MTTQRQIEAALQAVRLRGSGISLADLEAAIEAAEAAAWEPARPLEEWHEDIGDVLWWCFPIEEPPYVGTPLDVGQAVEVTIRDSVRDYTYTQNIGGWPGYHTHFTPLPPLPAPPMARLSHALYAAMFKRRAPTGTRSSPCRIPAPPSRRQREAAVPRDWLFVGCEAGHDWRFTGGCNANCRCGSCSVSVNVCSRCGDCDYGDNEEADEIRRRCQAAAEGGEE